MSGKVVLLGDIHGNYIALKNLIEALAPLSPSTWHLLGDALGYFPDGGRVLGLLRHIGCLPILGNHEDMVLKKNWGKKDAFYRLAAQRCRLSKGDLQWIATWPDHRILNSEEGSAFLVHGSPADKLRGYMYPDSDIAVFKHTDHRYIFSAHTHRPFKVSSSGTDFYNTGSVGLPRDGSGQSCCLIWDQDSGQLEHFFFPLDVTKIINEYGSQTHPEVLDRLEFRCEKQ